LLEKRGSILASFDRKKVLINLIERILRFLNYLLRTVRFQITYGIADWNPSTLQRVKSYNQAHSKVLERIAIVLQGPIINPQLLNLTLNLYRLNFPQSTIILSTWKDESNISKIEDFERVEVILSDKPENTGIQNLNLQIRSTSVAINHAKVLGLDFVLKTRTDQAMLASDALISTYLRWRDSVKSLNENRILTSDFNSFTYRPFHLNDQFQFMTINSAVEFWDEENDYGNLISNASTQYFPERILTMRFLSRINQDFTPTIKRGLEVSRDFYSIIDYEEIDLVWFKSTSRDLRHRFPQKWNPWEWSFLRYSDWCKLQDSMDVYLDKARHLEL
jgi:hypothetical protein